MKTLTRDPEAVLEDLAFLAETGVGTEEAAQRTGFPTANALDRWLSRHHRADVWHALRSHDPAPLTDPADARWGHTRRNAA